MRIHRPEAGRCHTKCMVAGGFSDGRGNERFGTVQQNLLELLCKFVFNDYFYSKGLINIFSQ